jgi:WD40 repeat protein/serine/threonine protein kinase
MSDDNRRGVKGLEEREPSATVTTVGSGTMVARGRDDGDGLNCETVTRASVEAEWMLLVTQSVKPSHTSGLDHTAEVHPSRCSVSEASACQTSGNAQYTLLDKLGEGGMGVVYRAEQRSLGREIALKVLKQGRGDSQNTKLHFLHEAAITGRLSHPNIVPLYDVGEDDEGRLFYTMKEIVGTPWSDAMSGMSEQQNLEAFLRVCDAVAFAHDNEVMHRDLKPANVMLGDHGEVLLVDWGLALQLRPNGTAVLEASGSSVAGTPAYMAPEMASGAADRIGAASDIYLLGAILFHLVTGRLPHIGRGVADCLAAATANRIDVPESGGELVDIACRAMATRPEDRYESVAAFQHAVRTYLSHATSQELTDRATENLASARDSGSYDEYARSLYGFEEALSLWEDNETALRGVIETRLKYAHTAMSQGDLELADSLVLSDAPEHAELRITIETKRRHRESRTKRLRRLTLGIYLLTGVTVVILAIAFVWVNSERKEKTLALERETVERTRAEEARRNEQEARGMAEKSEREAHRELANAYRDKAHSLVAEKDHLSAKVYAAASLLRSPENPFGPKYSRADEAGELARERQYQASIQSVLSEIESKNFLKLENVWTGHQSTIESIDFSPDGELLATGSDDGTLGLWAVPRGELLARLTGHSDFVVSVAFSPDGRLLASASYDGTGRLWDVDRHEVVATMKSEGTNAFSVSFSPDGKFVAVSFRDAPIVLWRTADPTGPAERLESGINGRQLAFCSNGVLAEVAKEILFWDYQQQTKLGELSGHTSFVLGLASHPIGNLMASGDLDGKVGIWDSERRVNLAMFDAHRTAVYGVAFSPDGRVLASGSADQSLSLWQAPDWQPVSGTGLHGCGVTAVAFAPQGSLLASGDDYGHLRLWSMGAPERSPVVRRVPGLSLDTAFSPDGALIATASSSGTTQVWKADTATKLAELQGPGGMIRSVSFSFDSSLLAAAGDHGTIHLWHMSGMQPAAQIPTGNEIRSLSFSSDGRTIASAQADGSVRIHGLFDGRLLAALTSTEKETWEVAFQPTGRFLASSGSSGIIRLWDVDSFQLARELEGHTDLVNSLDFSSDGKLLASAGKDRVIRLWDVATATLLREMHGHRSWVNRAVFSHDDAILASGSDGAEFKLWDVSTGAVLQSTDLALMISSLAFAPDDKICALAMGEELRLMPISLGLWKTDPAQLLKQAEEAAGVSFAGGELVPLTH